ncbi:MAG: STN domain-containing protein [Daejeonella sp.]
MKAIYLLLTAALLTIHSAGYTQGITFSGKNVPLKTIFSAIQKQTGYGFFYDPTLLTKAKPVTLNVVNAPLSDVLAVVFKNQPSAYSIENKTILASKKNVPIQTTAKQNGAGEKVIQAESAATTTTLIK